MKRPSVIQVYDALSRFQSQSVEGPPHAGDNRAAPTLDTRSEESIFGVAERRIDEIAEVPQPAISPSTPDRTSVLGAFV